MNPGDVVMEPAAQVDRCCMNILLGYGSPEIEWVARGAALKALKCVLRQIDAETQKQRLLGDAPCSGHGPRT